ncbi:inositol monophosphatase family protein [Rhizobium sp. C4]|uniref:inositol monophosphatase family protein n=1 Tax=Rhizobium sp. C4 TaxID=1349800 RepID=UPI001E5F9F8F|nr:inositol monophosphatase family protein [Rhizobium sp. C4]MCD2174833.1 inositol monophosphatase [Rhizobium sp. C4]
MLTDKADFCRKIIVRAGELVMDGFGQARAVEMKGPQDYLTEFDGRCEKFLRGAIAEAFPGDGFFGEEGGGGDAATLWVVDPIDGTANFARNIPHFCIAIAYVENGRAEFGAIFNPVLRELHFARRGCGATLNGKPIRVSGVSAAQAATIELGWSSRIAKQDYLDTMSGLLDFGFNVRRAGSGALGLAYVADGRNEAYAERHMNSWDCIAGLLMVEEAGGRVCSFEGSEKILQGGPVLASVPGLAGPISEIMRIPLAAPREKVR